MSKLFSEGFFYFIWIALYIYVFSPRGSENSTHSFSGGGVKPAFLFTNKRLRCTIQL